MFQPIFPRIVGVTEKIVGDKPKIKFCLYRRGKENVKHLLRFTLYDKVAPQLRKSVFANGWSSLMHNFKTH